MERGLIDRRIFADRGDLRSGVGADLRPLLAVRGTREPTAQPRGLHHNLHEGGPGHSEPGWRREAGRLHQHVPAPRQPGLPGGPRECHVLHLLLPRVGLQQCREAGIGAQLERIVFRGVGFVSVGLVPVAQLDTYKGLSSPHLMPRLPRCWSIWGTWPGIWTSCSTGERAGWSL